MVVCVAPSSITCARCAGSRPAFARSARNQAFAKQKARELRVPGLFFVQGLAQRLDEQTNLRAIEEGGVKIAICRENFGATSRSEALYLHELRVISNLELLRM
jgi:hypothetical protein